MIEGGTGLRGLIDRLAVLDGRLEVDEPARRRHAAGGAHPDRARLARGRGGAHMRRALAARRSLAPARRLRRRRPTSREPRPRRRAATRPSPPREAPDRQTRGVRIATARLVFITHGQASDSFWNVVQRGITEARRQTGVEVSYRAPDRFSIERMRRYIDQAVADRPGRAGRLAARRDRALAVDQGRGQGRHPRDHDQLRQRRVPQARRARARRPARVRGGRRGRRADGARGRQARAVRQPGERQRRPRPALPRPRRRPGARPAAR